MAPRRQSEASHVDDEAAGSDLRVSFGFSLARRLASRG